MRAIPMPRPTHQRAAARDRLREEQLDAVTEIVDRFLYDLGRIMAGHLVDLEPYVDRPVARAVCESLQPFLDSGHVLRPDFGPYGELRVEGDLLAPEQPVIATVEFEDRSTRETPEGRVAVTSRRRIRVRMRISLDPACVIEVAVSAGSQELT